MHLDKNFVFSKHQVEYRHHVKGCGDRPYVFPESHIDEGPVLLMWIHLCMFTNLLKRWSFNENFSKMDKLLVT